MNERTWARAVAGAGALVMLAGASVAADNFSFTITPGASTATYSVNAAAPFTGTMVGDTTATPPTRTKVGSPFILPPFVSCGTFGAAQNDPLTISGSITGSGSGNAIHPAGAFGLSADTAALTVGIRDLTLNLLGSSTASVSGGLSNFHYQSFCTVNPSCSLPFLIPISLTLGTLDITSMIGRQEPGTATGTLTASAGGGFDFQVPLTLTVTTAAGFNGAAIPIDPQPLPIVFTGHLTINGAGAAVTSTLNLDVSPPDNTTPTVLPAAPITTPAGTPICAGLNLILNLSVNSSHIAVTSSSTLVAAGARAACPCDWNHSGAVTVQDIFDFLISYFAGSADFNGAGGTTVQDVFDFLSCYFTLPFPC